MRAADFYRPLNSVAIGRVRTGEPWVYVKHANHYTTEDDFIKQEDYNRNVGQTVTDFMA
jgi:hypothetical protein